MYFIWCLQIPCFRVPQKKINAHHLQLHYLKLQLVQGFKANMYKLDKTMTSASEKTLRNSQYLHNKDSSTHVGTYAHSTVWKRLLDFFSDSEKKQERHIKYLCKLQQKQQQASPNFLGTGAFGNVIKL